VTGFSILLTDEISSFKILYDAHTFARFILSLWLTKFWERSILSLSSQAYIWLTYRLLSLFCLSDCHHGTLKTIAPASARIHGHTRSTGRFWVIEMFSNKRGLQNKSGVTWQLIISEQMTYYVTRDLFRMKILFHNKTLVSLEATSEAIQLLNKTL
jgi:hypothetical protein